MYNVYEIGNIKTNYTTFHTFSKGRILQQKEFKSNNIETNKLHCKHNMVNAIKKIVIYLEGNIKTYGQPLSHVMD